MKDPQVVAAGAAGLVCLFLACRPLLDRRLRAAGWLGFTLVAVVIPTVYGGSSTTHQLLNGIFLGSIYALIALGYTMVYGVLKMINFAHGEVFMVGAYVGGFMLMAYQQQPVLAIAIALLAAMVVAAGLGVLVERAAYRPLRGAPRLAALITAIGVSLLLQNVALLVVGPSPKVIPTVLPTVPVPWLRTQFGLPVNLPALVTLGGAVVMMVGLQFIVAKTNIGRAMRAVSEDREAACLMGVNVNQVVAATFIIGSALAGAGGVLWTMRYTSITPYMGVQPGLKAFVAAVLGGIGSVPGAMIGGMMIGILEVFVSAVSVTREQLAQATLFIVMMIVAWRGLDQYLLLLPKTAGGRAVQAVATLAVLTVGYLVAGWLVGLAGPLFRQPEPGHSLPMVTGSTFKDAVVFAVLVIILIAKPTGIMGRYAPEKV